MYHAWLLISDVGRGPDRVPLALVEVEYHTPFGRLYLGPITRTMNVKGMDMNNAKLKLYRTFCTICYTNDGDDPKQPDSIGRMLDVDLSLLYEVHPLIQPLCTHMTEADYGTQVAFETFPVLRTSPHRRWATLSQERTQKDGTVIFNRDVIDVPENQPTAIKL